MLFALRELEPTSDVIHSIANTNEIPNDLVHSIENLALEQCQITEIPEEFLFQHPHIIIEPTATNRLFPEDEEGIKSLTIKNESNYYDFLSQLNSQKLYQPDQVVSAITLIIEQIKRNTFEPEPGLLFDILNDCVSTYIRNLQLYKMCQKPETPIHRRGSPNEETIPSIRTNRYHSYTVVAGLPPFQKALTQYRTVTWWSVDTSYDPNMSKTVGELEQDHLICSDTWDGPPAVMLIYIGPDKKSVSSYDFDSLKTFILRTNVHISDALVAQGESAIVNQYIQNLQRYNLTAIAQDYPKEIIERMFRYCVELTLGKPVEKEFQEFLKENFEIGETDIENFLNQLKEDFQKEYLEYKQKYADQESAA